MTTRELEVAVRHQESRAVIDLVGDVNAAAEATLQAGYAEATHDGPTSLVLNFTRADYINSTGIALIVGLLDQARAQGVEITACGLSAHYREIFEITRLADFMTIADSEDSVLGGAEGSRHA